MKGLPGFADLSYLTSCFVAYNYYTIMTERELRKLEATIRNKMEDIKKQRVSLKDSGIGSLMNLLKQADFPLYEKIFPEYKHLTASANLFR